MLSIIFFIFDKFDSIENATFIIAGLLGMVMSVATVFSSISLMYRMIFNVFSIMLISVSLFYCGQMYENRNVQDIVDAYEQRLDVYEATSTEVNTIVETQVVEKIKVVKDTVYATKIKIKEHEKIINADCRIPDTARLLYNEAIKGNISGSTQRTDGSTNAIATTGNQ